MAWKLEVVALSAEQNKVSNLQLGGSHSLFQSLGPGLLGPAEVIPCLQNLILEVLGELFHCWAGELVGSGHRQGWVPTMIEKNWCLTQGWVH